MTPEGSRPVASAPGKILLAGEYAVLEGAEAVLVAIDRRARAAVTREEWPLEGFLAAVRDVVAAYSGVGSPAARAAGRITADSTALCAADGTKLGLGSSAAVTVAAVAAALATSAGAERDDASAATGIDIDIVHQLAHRAHATAQAALGARGSGADVAAAVHGGVLAARRTSADADRALETRRLQLPARLELVFVWTGAPAQTAHLVARVHEYRGANPKSYQQAIAKLADAAAALATAFEPDGDAAAAVDAIAAGGDAVAGLGRATGLALETSRHRRLRAIATSCGGSFKPTGAGAGDMAVAAFTDSEAALCFRHDAALAGISITDLSVDQTGVRIE